MQKILLWNEFRWMVTKKMKTLLHLTDNSIDPELYSVVKKNHLKVAGENKLICVSQKPVEDFGENICLGEIGRSWFSLYKAVLAGLENTETGFVSILEHDCLYSQDHIDFIPPKNDTFYYNTHHWLVEWSDKHPEIKGMYSYWSKRNALSQLVCNAEILKKSTTEILRLLNMGLNVSKGMKWYGEPGLVSDKYKAYLVRAFKEASSGESHQLQRYLREYVLRYKSEFFNTEVPNLDIRHDSNFTGGKRGKKRTFCLDHWGKFEDIMRGNV
jgi:hypothetical protein